MNMKNILLILITISFGPFINAQDVSTLDKVTTVEFVETTIDYGKIEKGSNGVRTFTFKNTGEHPLKIYNIYSACNCDIVSQPEEPIAPGKTGEIKVKYDTEKVGPIVKTITANTNTKEKLIPLNLIGEVLPANTDEDNEENEKMKM
ncbi:DUF1573 domain-containing protein [Nonlabens mediterrranea]|uniref:DUF1573 domain-containing protein n=1 Tax=Nonlabens mediterrranea TaxID=1419947 RepID=A0ABS0A2U8_9FLAO|nr:DUF1573 domain-containing protein [Nonlabens mediterrranea]